MRVRYVRLGERHGDLRQIRNTEDSWTTIIAHLGDDENVGASRRRRPTGLTPRGDSQIERRDARNVRSATHTHAPAQRDTFRTVTTEEVLEQRAGRQRAASLPLLLLPQHSTIQALLNVFVIGACRHVHSMRGGAQDFSRRSISLYNFVFHNFWEEETFTGPLKVRPLTTTSSRYVASV